MADAEDVAGTTTSATSLKHQCLAVQQESKGSTAKVVYIPWSQVMDQDLYELQELWLQETVARMLAAQEFIGHLTETSLMAIFRQQLRELPGYTYVSPTTTVP
jgi:hypothetical protein